MPPKAKKSAKKPNPKDQAEGHPEVSNGACDDEVAITAGDLTKSTAADTKNKPEKRAKKNTGQEEESKQAQPKKKRTARNKTNPNVMAMC